MKVIITTNKFHSLVSKLSKELIKLNFEVILPLENKDVDIFEAGVEAANYIISKKADRGIIIDEYGSGGFMVASKVKGTIVAQLADEHSAHMTRGHNNTNIITVGANLTAFEQLKKIIIKYLTADFEGGRHMVRIDMLDEMLRDE
ncbi:RpiB/LacA/LacB family sugar-phosphate isomerase [Spiroplasma endosymbiont of Labia minor]|uniref:RpiB/LacA/LacB family sugar-phosphate isomerase n=1 Tax=Spiroplasma endosymbiont of Labia minor TaxID=3066305 RepID=UPI0030CAB146